MTNSSDREGPSNSKRVSDGHSPDVPDSLGGLKLPSNHSWFESLIYARTCIPALQFGVHSENGAPNDAMDLAIDADIRDAFTILIRLESELAAGSSGRVLNAALVARMVLQREEPETVATGLRILRNYAPEIADGTAALVARRPSEWIQSDALTDIAETNPEITVSIMRKLALNPEAAIENRHVAFGIIGDFDPPAMESVLASLASDPTVSAEDLYEFKAAASRRDPSTFTPGRELSPEVWGLVDEGARILWSNKSRDAGAEALTRILRVDPVFGSAIAAAAAHAPGMERIPDFSVDLSLEAGQALKRVADNSSGALQVELLQLASLLVQASLAKESAPPWLSDFLREPLSEKSSLVSPRFDSSKFLDMVRSVPPANFGFEFERIFNDLRLSERAPTPPGLSEEFPLPATLEYALRLSTDHYGVTPNDDSGIALGSSRLLCLSRLTKEQQDLLQVFDAASKTAERIVPRLELLGGKSLPDAVGCLIGHTDSADGVVRRLSVLEVERSALLDFKEELRRLVHSGFVGEGLLNPDRWGAIIDRSGVFRPVVNFDSTFRFEADAIERGKYLEQLEERFLKLSI